MSLLKVIAIYCFSQGQLSSQQEESWWLEISTELAEDGTWLRWTNFQTIICQKQKFEEIVYATRVDEQQEKTWYNPLFFALFSPHKSLYYAKQFYLIKDSTRRHMESLGVVTP